MVWIGSRDRRRYIRIIYRRVVSIVASPDNAGEAICCGKAGWARRRLDERLDADQRNDEAITQEEEEPRRYEKDEGKRGKASQVSWGRK